MGGGDVKLLMALGAWGGLAFAEEVAVLGVLLGGVFAVVLLAFKGRLLAFVAQNAAVSALRCSSSELELELPQVDRKLTMPFGIPIAAAAIWSAVAHPLVALGVPPMAVRAFDSGLPRRGEARRPATNPAKPSSSTSYCWR